MNIKALITTLVIAGSSSVAMARPVTYSASAEAQWSFGYNNTSPVVRDHRNAPIVVRPAPMPVSQPGGDRRLPSPNRSQSMPKQISLGVRWRQHECPFGVMSRGLVVTSAAVQLAEDGVP